MQTRASMRCLVMASMFRILEACGGGGWCFALELSRGEHNTNSAAKPTNAAAPACIIHWR